MLRKFGMTSALVLAGLATPVVAEEHYVLMMGNGYFPDYIHPVVGDTIRFINMTNYPMSATADDGSWDTGVLQPSAEYVLSVTDGMKQTYGNSVTDAVDTWGAAVGIGVVGVIDYLNPANTTENTIVANAK